MNLDNPTRADLVWLATNRKRIDALAEHVQAKVRRKPHEWEELEVKRTGSYKFVKDAEGALKLAQSEWGFSVTECFQCCDVHRMRMIDVLVMKRGLDRAKATEIFDKLMEEYGFVGTREKNATIVAKENT